MAVYKMLKSFTRKQFWMYSKHFTTYVYTYIHMHFLCTYVHTNLCMYAHIYVAIYGTTNSQYRTHDYCAVMLLACLHGLTCS